MDQKVRDRLLGMMAVEKGLIKEKDLTKCLNIAEFSENKTMKEVMVEMGVLTQYKADKLERILERQSNPESARMPLVPRDDPFGGIAIEQGMATSAQVDAALAEQEEFKSGGVTIPIGQLLMSMGVLTADDVASLIERQGRRRLECVVDGAAYNVTGYDEDNFYTCPKCEGDLLPAAIELIPREKLETKLDSIRAKKQRAAAAAAAKQKAQAQAKARPKPKPSADSGDPFSDLDIDFDALDFGNDDDSDGDVEAVDDDDGLGDLMILEL